MGIFEVEKINGKAYINCEDFFEYVKRQEKEIERLNNIINDLEKYLNEQIQKSWEIEEQCYEDIESKLQELKGIDLTEKDKRQIKGLKEEFKIGDKE